MKTLKLPPLVIDEATALLINRLAAGSNVSNLLRDWIRTGIQSHPDFTTKNIDNLATGQLCVINKHGRPRKKISDILDTPATTCNSTSEGVADDPTRT